MADWYEIPEAVTSSICGGGSTGNYLTGTLSVNETRNYSYCYDKSTYSSLWTAYALRSGEYSSVSADYDKQYQSRAALPRMAESHSWSYNPDIATQYQVDLRSHSYGVDVGSTIYARGHQIPAADRNGNSAMLDQTYYCTNSTPQIQTGFNNGVWSTIEEVARFSAQKKSTTVYVVTGPVYKSEKTVIHPQDDIEKSVPVPDYYWKVLLKVHTDNSGNVTEASAIGFWLNHAVQSDAWYTFITSVDDIESKTGVNFFVNLPDDVEGPAETNSSWSTFSNF